MSVAVQSCPCFHGSGVETPSDGSAGPTPARRRLHVEATGPARASWTRFLVAGFHPRCVPPSSFLATLAVYPSPGPPTCFRRSRSWGLVTAGIHCPKTDHTRPEGKVLSDPAGNSRSSPMVPRRNGATSHRSLANQGGVHGYRGVSLPIARPFAARFRVRPDRRSHTVGSRWSDRGSVS